MEDQRNPYAQANDTSLLDEAFKKKPQGYLRFKKERVRHSRSLSTFSNIKNHTVSIDSVSAFCKKLLQLKEFESFKTVHLFSHEKGQSFAMKHEVSSTIANFKEFHINEFNTLFQRIKKSRRRSFGQEGLKGFSFDILGTFLAREFSLETHNIILIVSRNDFLSQTDEERDYFQKVTSVIPPFLDSILKAELDIQQHLNIRLVLEHLPFKINTSKSPLPEFKQLPSNRFFRIEEEEGLDKADVFHQERIALLGELLNTLRHELSNPLFGLQLSAELLYMEIENEDNKEFMKEISSAIKRSQSIIGNFTELYTSSEQIKVGDLEKLVNEVFTLTKSESRQIKKTFCFDGCSHEDTIIMANSVWLAQILFNLVVNSAQALNSSGIEAPEITVKVKLLNPVEIHVSDNGPGIPESVRKNMFKPFFTTKNKGTGLGLAISQSLAKKLNGKIEYNEKGQGAHFILKFKDENISS
tara:strand:+ start:7950 stop:9356 length:1407 start_codon:yes stop_codon:yes gene_type:complete